MADDREIPSVPGLFASGSASPSDMFGESGPQRTHGLVAGDLLPVKGDRDCRVEQLVLFGQPRPIRIPEQRSPSWLEDPVVAARLEAKRDKQPTRLCWPWIGGPSTGHGSFRAASLPGPSRRGTVPAHRFAYQLAYGGSSNWVVRARRCRDLSPLRFRRLHQPCAHAVGYQRHRQGRILGPKQRPGRPTGRCARRRRKHPRHRCGHPSWLK